MSAQKHSYAHKDVCGCIFMYGQEKTQLPIAEEKLSCLDK